MTVRVPRIARVRLARSVARLVRPTIVLAGVGGALVGLGVLAPFTLPLLASIGLVAGGVLLVLVGLWLGLRMLTVRLDVEEAAVRLHWLGGERIYPLTPGPVTRVRLVGEHASSLRAGSAVLGWWLGRGRLRGEEMIEVVRLAPTETAILVPTERGRLAIAPAVEAELLDALARAARARQRLEELARAAPPVEVPAPDLPTEPTAELRDLPERPDIVVGGAGVTEPARDPEPRLLTGIERAMLEAERARQQAEADAIAAAEAERLAGAEEGPVATADGTGDAPSTDRPTANEEAGERRRGPRWLRRDRTAVAPGPRAAAAPVTTEAPLAAAAAVPATAAPPADPAHAIRAPQRRHLGMRRPRPSVVFILLPLVGAGAVWGIASLTDRLPAAGTELARIVSLGLVLSGPATSIGAVMARTWWPRLVGVVVAGGLVATVFIARALVGPLN